MITALLAGGCAHYPVNAPLEGDRGGGGYRYAAYHASTHEEDLWLILAFSGGGTRAAALAYGVLEELAATPVGSPGREHRLLDEVDLISSVSGGSFTAAYYGLFGDRLFEDFESKFLKRNIQGRLARMILSPWNWCRLWSPRYNRDELAADYYDQHLFDGMTFADLGSCPRRPFVIINASDVVLGERFQFTQDQFDLICSDLNSLPVGRAVAASSSVPGLFGAVTLRNHAGHGDRPGPSWPEEILRNPDAPHRLVHLARQAASYADAERRHFVHLLDGGITDNLGLRGPLEMFLWRGPEPALRNQPGWPGARRVALIAVDATVKRDWGLDREEAPGLYSVLGEATSVPLDRYSNETVSLVHETLQQIQTRAGSRVSVYPVFLEFNHLPNEADRLFFQSVPTSLRLQDGQVDRLRALARRELALSESYQRLLRDLRQDSAPSMMLEPKP